VAEARHPLFLLALLVLPGQAAAQNVPAGERELCRFEFLRVFSPDAGMVSAQQCRAVAKQTMAAWQFDLDQMHWAASTGMERLLTTRVISVERMKTEHSGLLGFAKGRDLFVVSTAVLDNPFANGTLAHELAHIQAKRALGKYAEARRVPGYFIEGHGNMLGRAYRDYLRVADHQYDVLKARQVLRMTADEARTILTDDNYVAGDSKRLDKMEALGIFFVEYLRVRLHRTGIPDAVERMGRVFEAVGAGGTYEEAFRLQYGSSVDRVVSDIVALFQRTAANPAERLRGTRYEGYR